MKKSLVLTGMMGVGKSTIGRLIAKRLKVKFIDVDKVISDIIAEFQPFGRQVV